MPGKKRRLSLSYFDTREGPGAELLNLCREITADGRISKEDFLRLRKWLEENRNCPLPAVGFLCEAIDRAAADKIVTRDELADLYRRIERILPPEDRALAREKRRQYLQQLKEEQKKRQAALREAERQERLRREPVMRLDFDVAGVRYEGRGTIVKLYARAGDPVYLVRDYQNPFSINAVKVCLANGYQIGFVPEPLAERLAPLLDSGHRYRAWIKKILTRAHPPLPIIEAEVYHPEALRQDLIDPSYVPPLRRAGCLPLLVLAAVVIIVIAITLTALT